MDRDPVYHRTQKKICFLVAIGFLTFGADIARSDVKSVADNGAPLLVIVSPRHPDTHVLGANDKLSQDLEWDSENQMLYAKVTYSRVSGGGDDELDPSNYKTFSLPFPTIRLDPKNNLVLGEDKQSKCVLGHLENGSPVLKSNVRLIAHRHDGELTARLVVY